MHQGKNLWSRRHAREAGKMAVKLATTFGSGQGMLSWIASGFPAHLVSAKSLQPNGSSKCSRSTRFTQSCSCSATSLKYFLSLRSGHVTRCAFALVKMPQQESFNFYSLLVISAFPLWKVVAQAALGGHEICHDQQQSQIVLLAPHQDWTKQGRRCSHCTWPLVDLAALRWVSPPGLASPTFPEAFWSRGRTIAAEMSLFQEVTRQYELYEFHSCALCREISDFLQEYFLFPLHLK